MKTIAAILVLNIVAVLSMDIVVKVTLCSVENCSFFETCQPFQENLVINSVEELLSNHATKLANCQSTIASLFCKY